MSPSSEFIDAALAAGALRFGSFVLKSGRTSPYFFNLGEFNTGRLLGRLADWYAQTILASGLRYDVIFGPAYKGIPLAAATAVALANRGHDVPFAFNRKEAKDHGEGGVVVGAALRGRVLILDDVVTAGTSVRESVALIRACGAEPCGVAVALDRQEAVAPGTSASAWIASQYGLQILAIATLDDVEKHLEAAKRTDELRNIRAYRRQDAAP